MPKSNMLNAKAVSGIMEKLKNNIQYILLAIMAINLLYLSIYTNGKIDSLRENEKRLENELLSLRSMIQKGGSALDESIKSVSDDLEKVYSLNVEQTKTISQIPTDNAFFKKWITANHEDTLKSIQNLNSRIDSVLAKIGALKTSVDNIGFQKGGSTVSGAPKDNLDTVSL